MERKFAYSLALLLWGAIGLTAQPADSARFTVASVRMVDKPGETHLSPTDATTFTAENATLQFLTAVAYGVDSDKILNAPKWMDSTFYTIQARHEESRSWQIADFQAAMQALLAERFGLKAERVKAERPGFGLVITDGSSKLTPVEADKPAQVWFRRGQLHAGAITMRGLAGLIGASMKQPIADETHLPGFYAIDLKFRDVDDADSQLPSLAVAVREQLGLKLVKQPVEIQQLRIDSVNQQPTEN